MLEDRGGERIQVVVITADKGLCGAFNSNIIKAAQNFIGEHSHGSLRSTAVGRKGRDFFRKAFAAVLRMRQ